VHSAYADLSAKADALYAAAANDAEDGSPEILAETIWEAATDGTRQVTYFVTEEARQTAAGRGGAGSRRLP
jgi:hypothetical protein